MKKIKILLCTMLILNIFSSTIGIFLNAQKLYQENFNIENLGLNPQKVQKEFGKYKLRNSTMKAFSSVDEANQYLQKLNSDSKIHTGKHMQQDGVGNKYYWKDNNDIGNPVSGGYGNIKTYYKNGENWQFTLKNTTVVDTVQFMVLDKEIENIPKQTVIFCLQPLNIAEWISDTNANENFYQKLTAIQKRKVNYIVAHTTDLFKKTGNYDYLSAGQMMIWESIGATNIIIPNSIKEEWNELHLVVEDNYKIPSFIEENEMHLLTYNKEKKYYDTVLEDTNDVLDKMYLENLVGDYGDYHIENGYGKNKLHIWNENENSLDSNLIKASYNAMPVDSGNRATIHYENVAHFLNSGQDFASGINENMEISLRFGIKKAYGNIKFQKMGETEDKEKFIELPGVKFGLFTDTGEKIDEKITDENGMISWDNIELGNYYIQEINTLDQYYMDEQKYNFSIDEDGEAILINNDNIVINKLKKGEVILTKKGESLKNNDDTYIPLKGAEFTVYNDINSNGELEEEEKNKIEKIVYSDSDGKVDVNNLYYGNYIIKETKAPKGYINNGYQENFKISLNNEVIKLYGGNDLINDVIKGKVKLAKEGESNFKNKELMNAEFSIYEDNAKNNFKNSEPVETIITNEKGIAESTNLKYGNYMIKETKAPEGYLINETIWKFTIKDNNQIVNINNGEKIIDKAKKNSIHLIKEDQYENKIKNVEFTIYNDLNLNNKLDEEEKNANNIVDKIVTNEEGVAESKSLTFGKYLLVESKTPESYISDENPISVTIDENSSAENLKYLIKNELKEGNIKIIKKDLKSGENLIGAKFALYKDLNNNQKLDKEEETSQNVIFQGVTDNNGEILFNNVSYGNYILKEIEAPDGYKINKKAEKNIQILEDNKEYQFQIYNTKKNVQIRKFVQTGKTQKYSILIFLSFGCILFLSLRKQKLNRKNHI